jgi:hypothetical protein
MTTAMIDNARARRAILVMTLICMAAGTVAVVRLGVSVAASPRSLLLVEPVRYIEPAVRADPATVARGDAAASMVDDAGLIRSRIEHCRADEAKAVDPLKCLAVVDDALRASPASGELWLLRATLLAQFGEFGDPLRVALRNSFKAAPLEGWIVVPRLVLELRLYPVLPAELREQARTDLGGVLADPVQAHALAATYARDPAMRDAGKPAFDEIPPELVTRFAAFVRDAAETAAAEPLPAG